MDIDHLKEEIDCDEEGPATPVHVLLQNADKSLEDIGDEVIDDRPPADILNTDTVDVSLASSLNIDDQPSVSQMNQMAGMDAINNISAVDIVTLQPSQLQSMFQIMGTSSDGASYILSDGQLLQTTTSGESQGLQSVTLPNGMAALIQADCRDTDPMGSGQAVQLEDGTTAIITNMQGVKENALASKILQNQVIQLEDGTTGFLQAGFPGADGVQSVQLEDGSTAYISLFGEATAAGNLSIDTNPVQQPTQQAVEVAIGRNPQITSGPTGSVATASVSTAHIEASYHKANLLTLINHPTLNIAQKAPRKVVFAHQGMEGIETVGDKLDMTQPHVSERAIAMGDKAYKCMYEGCGRLYTTHHHLKVHERSHTGDKPFRCEFGLCGKAFPTGYGLKSHTRVHTGEKPYRCSAPECVKAFKTSGDLQKHVRTHTGERPFHCPFEGCNRSFTTSNIRKVHIRTHTGERPYVCHEDGCNKSFASATNYKNHIRIHTGEKPYVCTVEGCGKRFTEYSSLYKHHVVHTQSKPYVCNHCHKTYRQTSTLAMHKRTVHNDHDITLDPEGNLLGSVGRVQILEQCDLANIGERDPNMASESDGTLVISTSNASLIGGAGSQDGARMLTTLQTVPSGSSALLQHLRPTIAVDGVPQVYLITDPTQLSQTIKNLATQSGPSDKPSVVKVTAASDVIPKREANTSEATSSDTEQLLDGTSNVITVISPITEPPDCKDHLESIGS